MLPIVTALVLAINGIVHFLQYRDYLNAGQNSAKYIMMFAVMFLFFGFLIMGRGMNVIYYMAIFFSLISMMHQSQLYEIEKTNPLYKKLIIVASALSLMLLVFGILLRFMAG